MWCVQNGFSVWKNKKRKLRIQKNTYSLLASRLMPKIQRYSGNGIQKHK